MSNKHSPSEAVEAALQKRLEADRRRALAALKTLEELGILGELGPVASGNGHPKASSKAIRKRAKEGESLPGAIDRVLPTSGPGLTVAEIARILEKEGRAFGKYKAEPQISSAIAKRNEATGWVSDGERPARWHKTKGGGSS